MILPLPLTPIYSSGLDPEMRRSKAAARGANILLLTVFKSDVLEVRK